MIWNEYFLSVNSLQAVDSNTASLDWKNHCQNFFLPEMWKYPLIGSGHVFLLCCPADRYPPPEHNQEALFYFSTKVLYYLFDEKKITAWLFSLSVALFFNKWVRTTNTYLQLTSFSLVFRDEKWGKKCFHANFISATDVKFSSHDVLLPHRGSTLYLGLGWGNSFRGHTYSL